MVHDGQKYLNGLMQVKVRIKKRGDEMKVDQDRAY